MRDYIVNKVYRDPDTQVIHRGRVGIHPGDIHYYEEYDGDMFGDDITAPLCALHLYSGNGLIVLATFEQVNAVVEEYKELARTEAIFKMN